MYHARIDSHFGSILLCATREGLAGLYFTDQKDCPPLADGPPVRADSRRPGSGVAGGIPLRTLRPVRSAAHAAGNPRASRSAKGSADGQMALFDHEHEFFIPAGDSTEAGSARGKHSAAGDDIRVLADELANKQVDELTDDPDDEPVGGLELLQEDTPAETAFLFMQVQTELTQYFAGRRRDFSFPLHLSGTPFQMKVWNALCSVPYGEVVSYGDLAVRAGMTPGHGRPVGTAVGRNPVAIVVPCHRIIGSNRTLTGYTGGLERKVALLELEGFAFGR